MKRILLAVMTAVVLISASAAQDRDRSAEAKARVKEAAKDTDVTYGSIKELTAGQKVVIHVENAPDKTFELASNDVKVNLAKGLKVGDHVRVREQEVAGKTKAVTITKHAGKGTAAREKEATK